VVSFIPAQALVGPLSPGMLAQLFTAGAFLVATWLFGRGLEKYASASS